MLDVAIVGAGPVGSRAAYRLAQKGYSVTVLDKRPSAGLKNCCTGIISQECINRFNIPSNTIYRQISEARLLSPSGDLVRICKPNAQASVVNRSTFDIYLAQLAQKQGAEYNYNTRVINIKHQIDRVVLSCQNNFGTSILEARTAIMACGFNTALVRKSGFGQCRYFTTGAQSEVQIKGLEEVEIYFGQQIAPGFFAWLVPTQNGRVLAGLMTQHAAGNYLKKWLQDLTTKNRIEFGSRTISYGGIPMYPLARTFNDRLLVVGDAAGQVKPTTGGGIYFGMLCADIATNTLHKGFSSSNLSAISLSDYQHDWHKLLKKEIRSEYTARRMYQKLSDSSLEKIFAIAKSGDWADRILATNMISFDWHGKVLFRLILTGLFSTILEKIYRVFKHNK